MGALYLKAKATGEQRELLEFRHCSALRSRVRQTGPTPEAAAKTSLAANPRFVVNLSH